MVNSILLKVDKNNYGLYIASKLVYQAQLNTILEPATAIKLGYDLDSISLMSASEIYKEESKKFGGAMRTILVPNMIEESDLKQIPDDLELIKNHFDIMADNVTFSVDDGEITFEKDGNDFLCYRKDMTNDLYCELLENSKFLIEGSSEVINRTPLVFIKEDGSESIISF